MQRILSLTLAVVIFIYLTAGVTGYLVDSNYQGETEFVVDYIPSDVWQVLNDIEAFQYGKKDVEWVEVLGKYLTLYAWIEHLESGGFRRYRQIERIEDQKIVFEMTDSSYDVTGKWEFNLFPEGKKTRVKITENSYYNSIIGRGFQYYFGLDKETGDWRKLIQVRLFNNLLTTP